MGALAEGCTGTGFVQGCDSAGWLTCRRLSALQTSVEPLAVRAAAAFVAHPVTPEPVPVPQSECCSASEEPVDSSWRSLGCQVLGPAPSDGVASVATATSSGSDLVEGAGSWLAALCTAGAVVGHAALLLGPPCPLSPPASTCVSGAQTSFCDGETSKPP